ncbi:MAG: NAD(P)H-binding protein [Rhodocyclaceae bacterium]|nr:NAD(P)H-binding protein [Rhodocyclaceae bacterium]
MTRAQSAKAARRGGPTILLFGATGAVGQAVLALALADPRVGRVVAVTRRPLPARARLDNVVADPATLAGDEDCWRTDGVVCTLGTTIATAGSRAAFAAVDRDLVLQVARLARQAGASRFALNSSLGADPRSGNFYLRTKGEAEAGLRALGYPSLTVVRPSLIDAERAESRPGERLGIVFARAFRPLIPARYRAVTPTGIARALLDGALAGPPGDTTIESDALSAAPR